MIGADQTFLLEFGSVFGIFFSLDNLSQTGQTIVLDKFTLYFGFLGKIQKYIYISTHKFHAAIIKKTLLLHSDSIGMDLDARSNYIVIHRRFVSPQRITSKSRWDGFWRRRPTPSSDMPNYLAPLENMMLAIKVVCCSRLIKQVYVICVWVGVVLYSVLHWMINMSRFFNKHNGRMKSSFCMR